MKAVVIEGSNAIVKDVTSPHIKEDQILIKTLAVAVNPTDWKHAQFKIGPQGSILGCDVSGQVVKLGSNVKDTVDISEGDIVSGCVHGASVKHPENGAFAEYVAVDPQLIWKFRKSGSHPDSSFLSGKEEFVPEGKVNSLIGLTALPVSLNTAGMVLVRNLGIDLNWKSANPQRDEPVIVWGGATAFGQCFIQLASQLKAFNKIVVVASRKHEPLLKEYGADELFDYHDSDVINKIKKEYPEAPVVVNAVSTPQTYDQIYKTTADTKQSLIINLSFAVKTLAPKQNVKQSDTMLYAMTGEDIPFGPYHIPKNLEYRKDAIRFIKWAQQKIDSGEIHHMPIRVSKGLESVPSLMELIKTGKNSGAKLVATV